MQGSQERVAQVPGVGAHIPWARSDISAVTPCCLRFDAQPCNQALLWMQSKVGVTISYLADGHSQYGAWGTS